LAFFVAAFVLLGQLTLGPSLVAQTAFAAGLDLGGDVPICHAADPGDGASTPDPRPGHRSDCALCVVCHALGAAAVLPGPAPVETAPLSLRHCGFSLPPARAPPVPRFLAAAYPTGPPRLA